MQAMDLSLRTHQVLVSTDCAYKLKVVRLSRAVRARLKSWVRTGAVKEAGVGMTHVRLQLLHIFDGAIFGEVRRKLLL